MTPQNLAARFLRGTGVLLVLLGIVHLIATPHIPDLLKGMGSLAGYRMALGPALLNHVLVGVLLIPLGYSTWLAASPGSISQRWARQLLTVNAVIFLLC